MIPAALLGVLGILRFLYVILWGWSIPMNSNMDIHFPFFVVFTFIYIIYLFIYLFQMFLDFKNPKR